MNDLQELTAMRAEVTGRLPGDLRQARDLLLAEISAAGQAGPARRADQARRLDRIADGSRLADRHGRIWPRATLAGATAVAAAAAITAGLVAGSPGRPRPAGHPAGGAAMIDVAYVLGHAALAAAAAHQPVPRPDQFIYISSVATELALQGGDVTCPASAPSATSPGCHAQPLVAWLTLHDRRIWLSASGYRAGVLQTVEGNPQKLPWGVPPPPLSGSRVEWDPLPALACAGAAPPQGSYTYLTTLPTDPARLRTWIYSHKNGGQPADQQAWTDIGDLLRETLVPPELAAALFRVAATIPGVTVGWHATDAAGRSGIAVSRYDSGLKANAELIFDARTYQFLGERSTLAAPVEGEGPAGTVIESTAQLQVSVVNALPQSAPASQAGSGAGSGGGSGGGC
jgi:hypothetical protein